MKINNFRGDLTDVSDKTETLLYISTGEQCFAEMGFIYPPVILFSKQGETCLRYVDSMNKNESVSGWSILDDDDEDMSGQVMVGQADPGTLASGNGSDNTDSQVVLGVANVHEDAVLL